jgi:hypothetical protein
MRSWNPRPSARSRPATSPRTRSIVVSEAPPPGPKISSWAVIASMSPRHVAPAASEHAAAASARPDAATGRTPTGPSHPPVRCSTRAGQPAAAAHHPGLGHRPGTADLDRQLVRPRQCEICEPPAASWSVHLKGVPSCELILVSTIRILPGQRHLSLSRHPKTVILNTRVNTPGKRRPRAPLWVTGAMATTCRTCGPGCRQGRRPFPDSGGGRLHRGSVRNRLAHLLERVP